MRLEEGCSEEVAATSRQRHDTALLALSSGGSSSGSTGQVECKDPAACGSVPAFACNDGSTPHGKGLQKNDGTCAWENPGCPEDKDAGPAPTACFDKDGKLLDSASTLHARTRELAKPGGNGGTDREVLRNTTSDHSIRGEEAMVRGACP